MSLKIDLCLQQLKGLEDYLAANRVQDARNAIEGIRTMLLSTSLGNKAAASKQVLPSFDWMKKVLAGMRRTIMPASELSRLGTKANFSDEIVCWGWYDVQSDSLGRQYRWCGNEPEAGFKLPFDMRSHAAVVMSIRPSEPDRFTQNSLEMRINGIPSRATILQGEGEKIVDIVLAPEQFRSSGHIEVSFYLKGSLAPSNLVPKYPDARKLAFNVFEFTWIDQEVSGSDVDKMEPFSLESSREDPMVEGVL